MKTFSSLAAVMALWLAVSFFIWLIYRIFRSRDGSKQKRLASSAIGLIDEGSAIFAALRARASLRVNAQGNYGSTGGAPGEILKEDVRSLLNAIETQSPYFEGVNILKKKIQNTFDLPDFLALSEILQIRRDFWAASEIFLMEGIRELGPEFTDASAFDTFQAEARTLLFKDGDGFAEAPKDQDPVELRLSIAREDALAFQVQVERTIAAELEKSRFPTLAELIAVPWSVIKGTAAGLREIRYLLGDAAVTAQSLARAMTSKGLKGAAEELRRARTDMPSQFATAFERAGGLARQGGQGLKRHYEFVIEAQELRTRYAELLSRAPDLSEKGKQFLARLELERRGERFRETSGNLLDAARQGLVVGIAYLIAGLQYVQARVTPPGHKQLAPLPAGTAVASEPAPANEPEMPLRVLLLPASSYAGGNLGQASSSTRRRRPKAPVPDTRPKAELDKVILAGAPKKSAAGRLRDFVTGETSFFEEGPPAGRPARARKPSKPAKPRVTYAEGLQKISFKELLAESAKDSDEDLPLASDLPGKPAKNSKPDGRSSLLERLSSIEPGEQVAQDADVAKGEKPKPKPKGWFFFGFKRR
jgi:hypothetical protein